MVDTTRQRVHRAPPIAMWMLGVDLEEIVKWVERKNGTINHIEL
jgi:hypothetical protein